ncbi:hypothetical protein N7478_009800 [Penicillium angulare]|uniref:uncharacterized protein n=1 Tax=Penicillium angulare TaxID=116970 RepID=UPI002541D3DE|nr:uncharacterized protein N7478_009800 [Penicillium angulare]KAJ5266992.1 hypothetical protein N7478_009800 [Penicillium angulare]
MALSACNAVTNPGFESGVLFPWHPSAVNVAKVSNGTSSYSGDHYLALTTAIDNGANTISQLLKGLKPGTKYTFTAEAQVPYDSSEYCFIYAYAGHNATRGEIAQQELDQDTFGSWVSVTGSFVAKKSTAELHVSASCDSEDNSYTGLVWLDSIGVVPEGGCGS